MTYYWQHRDDVLAKAKRRYRTNPRCRRRQIMRSRMERLAERMLKWWRERQGGA